MLACMAGSSVAARLMSKPNPNPEKYMQVVFVVSALTLLVRCPHEGRQRPHCVLTATHARRRGGTNGGIARALTGLAGMHYYPAVKHQLHRTVSDTNS
jgi:hypothetical protein